MFGALATGCRGDVGVRAVITLADGMWDPRRPFDHIRVEASANGTVEVACLFPRDNLASTGLVIAVDPAKSDRHACADVGPRVIDADLSHRIWGLEAGGSRTVNFVWPSNETVTLSASAGFGGKLDVLTATAQASPSGSFADVALALGNPVAPFLATMACPIELAEVSRRFECAPKALVDCLFPANNIFGHTGGMFGVAGLDSDAPKRLACRSYNTNTKCQMNSAHNLLVSFTGLLDVPPAKVDVYATLRGRFARCASGDMNANCPISTDCKPPFTDLVTTQRSKILVAPTVSHAILTCLPPTAGFVELRVKVAAAVDAVSVGVLAQDIKNDAGGKSCFFDMLDFDYQIEPKIGPQP